MKHIILVVLCLLLLISLCILCNLYLIGEPVDGTQLFYSVRHDGQAVDLNVFATDSAVALKGWSFKQDGSTLYIRARKVLISPFFPSGDYHTVINTNLLTEIYLGGQLIWSANK